MRGLTPSNGSLQLAVGALHRRLGCAYGPVTSGCICGIDALCTRVRSINLPRWAGFEGVPEMRCPTPPPDFLQPGVSTTLRRTTGGLDDQNCSTRDRPTERAHALWCRDGVALDRATVRLTRRRCTCAGCALRSVPHRSPLVRRIASCAGRAPSPRGRRAPCAQVARTKHGMGRDTARPGVRSLCSGRRSPRLDSGSSADPHRRRSPSRSCWSSTARPPRRHGLHREDVRRRSDLRRLRPSGPPPGDIAATQPEPCPEWLARRRPPASRRTATPPPPPQGA